MRYGHRSDCDKQFDLMVDKTISEGFKAKVKNRILIGAYLVSSGFIDAVYTARTNKKFNCVVTVVHLFVFCLIVLFVTVCADQVVHVAK